MLLGIGLLERVGTCGCCSTQGVLGLLNEEFAGPTAGVKPMLSGDRLVYPGLGMASCLRKLEVLIADELQARSTPAVVAPPPTRALLFKPPVTKIKEMRCCYMYYDMESIRRMKI